MVHPSEYGEPPDDIQLWHAEFIKWTADEWKLVKLWRCRFGDKWSVAITGPVTFSIDDGTFGTRSTSEVLQRYRDWYNQEGIGTLMSDTNT